MPATNAPMNALVIGGLSHVGRHLVASLVGSAGAVGHIRVVDRLILQQGFLSPEHANAFSQVEYIQANLGRGAEKVKEIFTSEKGPFHWVFYCAADIPRWEVEEVFHQRFEVDAVACAHQAVASGAQTFLAVSSGMPYVTERGVLADESSTMVAYSTCSTYLLRMEKGLREIKDLPLIIVRPAVLWGPDERRFWISVLAACDLFARAGETYIAPVGERIDYSTVHVRDVARALIHLAQWYPTQQHDGAVVYNLADDASTSPQDFFTSALQIFPRLKAKLLSDKQADPTPEQLEAMCEEINTVLAEGWIDLLAESGICNTPVHPGFEQEYCSYRPYPVNGRAIVRDTGFTYQYDGGFNAKDMKEIVEQYMDMGVWPRSALL